jgi:hypothetical protein
MMPPGIAPPKIKKKELQEGVVDKIKEDQREAIKAEVARQKADPEAPLRDLERGMKLVPDSKFLSGAKDYKMAHRVREKVSGDGDDDDDDGEDEDKKK